MSYRVINGRLFQTQDIADYSINSRSINARNKSNNESSFDKILKSSIEKQNEFKLSNHAAQRLKYRNINFNESDMKKINEGINKADGKGSKDCLILYKDVALVANIKNRTIITAVDKNAGSENVFTNIDSVVLL